MNVTRNVTSAATMRAVPTMPGPNIHYAGHMAGPPAYSVSAQPEATRADALSEKFGSAVEDYEQRLADGRPYEDTVDREGFRRRYGV